ncbi:MAG: thioredoxin-dependent thiol peroxidase [bacterium]|nr:thioredoxin-dependent thiol peroxidase [bacterium]
MLNEGDKAPDFTLAIEDGSLLTSSDLKGTPFVLYFYPKDDTSGCTTEAIDFTKLLADFTKLKTRIIGISPDSVNKHVKFIDKHDLHVTLGADEDKSVAMDYGVWAEKRNYGRTYMGIVRTTFLIDKTGHIAKIWNKVRVKDHAAAVLEATSSL